MYVYVCICFCFYGFIDYYGSCYFLFGFTIIVFVWLSVPFLGLVFGFWVLYSFKIVLRIFFVKIMYFFVGCWFWGWIFPCFWWYLWKPFYFYILGIRIILLWIHHSYSYHCFSQLIWHVHMTFMWYTFESFATMSI